MGMEAATLGLILGGIGSGAASGLLSPEPDQLGSFEGTGADPEAWLTQSRGLLQDLLGSSITRANEPISLPTPDLRLPSFSGGGLPMAIGTTPKRNAVNLTAPGANIPQTNARWPTSRNDLPPGLPGDIADRLPPWITGNPPNDDTPGTSPRTRPRGVPTGDVAIPRQPSPGTSFLPTGLPSTGSPGGLDPRTRSAANLLLMIGGQG